MGDNALHPETSVRPAFIAALLLALYFALAISASVTKSNTFDEIVHLTAGYNAWINHDQRFDPGNGDFVKRWAALPLLASRPAFPPLEGEAWRSANFFAVSRDFLFQRGNDPDAILLQARSMVALLGVALGALVFGIARRIFGDGAALLSTALFAFCPHMLAHGTVVSSDLALTGALLASTWCLWRLLHLVTWPGLLASLLAFGVLVISKMSAVLIVPIAAVLIAARACRREPWHWRLGARAGAIPGHARQCGLLFALVLAHAFAGWAAIWTVFEFKYHARADTANTQLALMHTPGARVDGVAARVSDFAHRHRLLPEGFLKGMEELVGISQRRPAFMNGEWHTGGRAAFFPYAFWAKTSPALLLLLLAGVVAAWVAAKRRWLYEALPLLALFLVYGAVAITQGLNIGHRHILPLYPVCFILAGSVAVACVRWRVLAVATALLLGWYAFDSLAVRPNYLAYFSPAVGGPAEGYRRLVDSSLDWGQDLPGLRRWLETHNPGDRDTVFFSYFGTGDPEHYEIGSWRLPGFPEWRPLTVHALTPGVYAISATMFQQVYAETFGPWNARHEAEYQTTLQQLGLNPLTTHDHAALRTILKTHPDTKWQEIYGRYEKLRFGRLCAWLRARQREPEAQIGYSILVWRLDDAALQSALWGPAP